MRANTLRIWSSLGLLLIGASLYGSIVAPQSLLKLERSADLIVHAVASGNVQNGTTVNFSLQVGRVIKGDAALMGNSLATYWDSGEQGAVGSTNGAGVSGSGIWFLQRTGSAWRVIPVLQGTMHFSGVYFPAPQGPILSAYAYSQSASVQDKLASEIGLAIENDNGSNFQLYALQAGVLDQLKSPTLQVLYRRMANSTSVAKRVLGLSGLIRAGDASALATAAQFASAVRGDPAEGVLIISIRENFRATDTDSVGVLGQAAIDSSNPSQAFREAAAHALAAIHTPAALPFLATLLDDPDFGLRVEAVGGMGAFANGLAVQTSAGAPTLAHLQLPDTAPHKTADTVAHLAFGRSAIARNEASYLSFWKGWWLQNRTSLGY